MLAFERHSHQQAARCKDLLSIARWGSRRKPPVHRLGVAAAAETGRPRKHRALSDRRGQDAALRRGALARGTSLRCATCSQRAGAQENSCARQTSWPTSASLATHYSLAHPGKTFQLIAGGGELLHVHAGPTLRERVYQVSAARRSMSWSEWKAASASCSALRRTCRVEAVPSFGGTDEPPSASPPHRLRFAAAGPEGQPQFDLHLRQRPPILDAAAARDLLGVYIDAARLLSFRAAVLECDCEGWTSTSSFEDRSALPASVLSCTIYPRHSARPSHRDAARPRRSP